MIHFGQVITAECENVPPPPDARCSDPAFAIANPDICPPQPALVVKPGVGLVCVLGEIQFKAYYSKNSVETDVTDQAVFASSNIAVAVIGATSGKATGLSAGEVTITASYDGMTAYATLSVIGTDEDCCDDISVGMLLMLDVSKSMGMQFSGYSSRLGFAKVIAAQFASEVNTQKDSVGLMSFHAAGYTDLVPMGIDLATMAAEISGAGQTQQLTAFSDALTAAISTLDAAGLDRRVLVLFSDGEETTAGYTDEQLSLNLLSNFKNDGGIVICVGCRASGTGYSLLQAFATGGMFINSYPGVSEEAIALLSGLKGYICAGNCVPAGDETLPTGEFDYCEFQNWVVEGGRVDLLGLGFVELLPLHGLYVDLYGTSAPHKGKLVLASPIAVANVGHDYRLTVQLAGNQRAVNTSPESVRLQVFRRLGDTLSTPGAPSNLVITAGATPLAAAETCTYYLTWISANGETLSSAGLAATVNNVEDQVTFDLPVIEAGCTGVKIWRTTTDDPGGVVVLLETVDETETTYTDLLRLADVEALIAAGDIDLCDQQPLVNTTGTPSYYLNQIVSMTTHTTPFTTHGFTFPLDVACDLWISIQQLNAPAGVGSLLDEVRFEDATDGTILFLETWDDENPTYIPPACGVGTVLFPGYGYAYGYNCYGDGCLSEPPGPQAPDPNPLSDIESGYTPPQTYSATKTECARCDSTPNLISTRREEGVAETVIITGLFRELWNWDLAAAESPLGFYFAGMLPAMCTYALRGHTSSLAGTINSGTLIQHGDVLPGIWFIFDYTGTDYKYYQLDVTRLGGGVLGLHDVTMIVAGEDEECATRSATSELSQQDANTAASTAAQAAAEAALNCVEMYTATGSYTAKCTDPNTYGPDVTKSATATSIVSLAAAQARADALAKAAATAALECDLSNNTHRIDILEGPVCPISASPYPSVQYVDWLTNAPITKVTVTLWGYYHDWPNDVHVLLLSPAGDVVVLMNNCGGTGNGWAPADLTFDDDAGVPIPDPPVTGTYTPTKLGLDFTPSPPYPGPAAPPPYGTLLSAFNYADGTDGNGAWSLWVLDDSPAFGGYIALGWELTIQQ